MKHQDDAKSRGAGSAFPNSPPTHPERFDHGLTVREHLVAQCLGACILASLAEHQGTSMPLSSQAVVDRGVTMAINAADKTIERLA
jgi:hypothetical protein